ncbi:MAG: hypothetical protein WGN25_19610 [Candidatus Electrothrix sp. GW3-4]|uniref:hypothetical protein n=1 Tax=Candidatus Electrothrix sp. GW3-4 TaxID=3126740 RepID=UPI0030D0BFEB
MENQPATPKIDFEIDDDFNAALVITCGNCSTVTKMPSEVLTPDKHIKCTGCDYEFKLTADDINTIQTYLEDAKKLY